MTDGKTSLVRFYDGLVLRGAALVAAQPAFDQTAFGKGSYPAYEYEYEYPPAFGKGAGKGFAGGFAGKGFFAAKGKGGKGYRYAPY